MVRSNPSGAGSLGMNTTVYEYDFFSGSQIGIYIGDILVDDIDSIQFMVSQSKTPIYGYASQYYHKIADGHVLVQGAFTIPFKEADYILAVLEHYTKNNPPIFDLAGPNSSTQFFVSPDNIERYLRRQNDDSHDPYTVARDLSALPDETFEDIAEKFEDLLWRKPEDKFMEPNVTSFQGNTDNIRRADQFPPFDIYILYGDIANAAANHTIKKLIDVSILGQGQAIQVSGEPLQEQYRFVCRNLA